MEEYFYHIITYDQAQKLLGFCEVGLGSDDRNLRGACRKLAEQLEMVRPDHDDSPIGGYQLSLTPLENKVFMSVVRISRKQAPGGPRG